MANFRRHLFFIFLGPRLHSVCAAYAGSSGHLPQPASTEVVTQSSSLCGGALRDETNKRGISSRASGFFGVSFTCREKPSAKPSQEKICHRKYVYGSQATRSEAGIL